MKSEDTFAVEVIVLSVFVLIMAIWVVWRFL